MKLEAKFALAREFFEGVAHCQSLNMDLQSLGEGQANVSMPYDINLIGDPKTQVIHGGAVSALLDTCGGVAVICHPSVGSQTATLTLNINYMRSAKPGCTITAKAHCYHVTRNVAFVHVVATDNEEQSPVATANGAFTVG